MPKLYLKDLDSSFEESQVNEIFKELLLFVLLLLVVGVNAQDYGPVNVDLDGYINDRAGEFHKSNVQTPKKEEKKA